jgi:hypothetical protein
VQVNEHGQPCGPSSTEFANFIGALVRTKGFPVAHDDWRKVCPKAKWKLWTDAQVLKFIFKPTYSCPVFGYNIFVCCAAILEIGR